MINLEELKVIQLRKILTEEFQFSPQEAQQIKGKKTLIQTIKNETANLEQVDDTILDNLEIQEEQEKSIDNTIEQIDTPTPSSPNWTEYVLNELTEDEKIKDKNNANKEYPTTDGLRRLVEKFVGIIVKSNTEICQTPSPENERRATVVVHIGVLPNINYNNLLECSGAADVYSGNSAIPFSNHPVATAETKSEGRAYKRLLKIKVSTYEEVAGSLDKDFNNSPTIESTNQFIKQDQINFIDTLSSRLNINVQKFIQHFLPNFHLSLNQLPYEESCGLLALLQQYQREGKNALEIPEDIIGYDGNWQNHWYKQDGLIKSEKQGEKE